MHEFPHVYRVTARSAEDSHVTLETRNVEPIESAAPVEFDGPGDRWSPETLLVAAVGDCFILSFRAIARVARFAWETVECEVDGTLSRTDGRLQFSHFELRVRLKLPRGGDAARADKLLHKAEAACLITNSLAATTALDTSVLTAQ